MNPYLIALDMDGTLLNNKKGISFLTKHYLTKLSKNGHKVILSSGRPTRSLYPYHKLLKLDSPMICYNGSLVYSPIDTTCPTTIFELPHKVIRQIYKEIKPFIVNFMCESSDQIYIDKEDSYLDRFFIYKGMKINKGSFEDIIVNDQMTFILHYSGSDEDKSKLEKILEKYDEVRYCFWTNSPYFEFTCKGISKGSSVKLIAGYYHIPKENIIAFGDADNDREMLNSAGVSVAMSNGSTNLKKIARMISEKDNNHNGIYHTLKKIMK